MREESSSTATVNAGDETFSLEARLAGMCAMPTIRLLSTGGTIASTATSSGEKTPSVSGADIVSAVPEIEQYVTLEVDDCCQLSGFQMDGPNANRIADAVEQATADGVDGVVVTHGTDTMAETAYFLEMVLESDLPVVVTGSQRSFDQLGTDGPTNLLLAVRTAADERFRDAGGVYVAFNDSVHGARWACKAHSSKLETVQSPGIGPVAEQTPTGLQVRRQLGPHAPEVTGSRLDPAVRVEIVTNALGMDGHIVERLLGETTRADEPPAVDGLVLAGTGLGNATAALGETLEEAIDAGVPVVLTTRCHAGPTAGVYGGPGGAATLLEAGAIAAGTLPAWKARLALWTLLSADTTAGEPGAGTETKTLEAVREYFAAIDSL